MARRTLDDWQHTCLECGLATSWTCDTMPPKSEQCKCSSNPSEMTVDEKLNQILTRLSTLEKKLNDLDSRTAGMINFGGR